MEMIKANHHHECSKRKSENEVSATVLQNKYANLFDQNVQQTHSLNLEAAAGKTSRINMKKNGSDPKATTNDITIAVLAKNLNCRQFGQKQSLHKMEQLEKEQFPHSFGQFAQNYAETVPFHKISTPGKYLKLGHFTQ